MGRLRSEAGERDGGGGRGQQSARAQTPYLGVAARTLLHEHQDHRHLGSVARSAEQAGGHTSSLCPAWGREDRRASGPGSSRGTDRQTQPAGGLSAVQVNVGLPCGMQ